MDNNIELLKIKFKLLNEYNDLIKKKKELEAVLDRMNHINNDLLDIKERPELFLWFYKKNEMWQLKNRFMFNSRVHHDKQLILV